MALLLPIASDPLSVPDHAFQHRVIAVDESAPEQSITVDDTGKVTINGEVAMVMNPITNVGYIDFDLINGIAQAEGRMVWNDDDGTVNIGMKGGIVNLQVGQEMLIRVRNDEGSDIVNGNLVRVQNGVGSFPTIELSNATEVGSGVIGIATEDIANNQFGYITTKGLVRGDTDQPIDTSSYAPGTSLFLANTDGQFTNVYPTSTERKVFIGTVVRQHATEGIILINIINVPFLPALSGMGISSAADGQIIQYASGTGLWSNVGGSGNTIDFKGANLTTSGALTLSSLSQNSVLFAGSGGLVSERNPGFTYDAVGNIEIFESGNSVGLALSSFTDGGIITLDLLRNNNGVPFGTFGSDGGFRFEYDLDSVGGLILKQAAGSTIRDVFTIDQVSLDMHYATGNIGIGGLPDDGVTTRYLQIEANEAVGITLFDVGEASPFHIVAEDSALTFRFGASTFMAMGTTGNFDFQSGNIDTKGDITAPNVNTVIYVEGNLYPRNATGIQAAIDAVTAQGGGIVELTAGAYTDIDTTLELDDNTILRGHGESTTLKSANGLDNPILVNEDYAGASGGNANIVVENIWFDGNRDNQSVPWAIGDSEGMGNIGLLYFDETTNVTVRGCKIFDSFGSGLEFINSTQGTAYRNWLDGNNDDGIAMNIECSDFLIDSNWITDHGKANSYGGSSCIEVQDHSFDITISNNILVPTTDGSSVTGIRVTSHSTYPGNGGDGVCGDINIIGNKIKTATYWISIGADASDSPPYDINIVNNYMSITGVSTAGIYITRILGGKIEGNYFTKDYAADAVGNGILSIYNATDLSILDNVARVTVGGSNSGDAGIYLGSPFGASVLKNVRIENNQFVDFDSTIFRVDDHANGLTVDRMIVRNNYFGSPSGFTTNAAYWNDDSGATFTKCVWENNTLESASGDGINIRPGSNFKDSNWFFSQVAADDAIYEITTPASALLTTRGDYDIVLGDNAGSNEFAILDSDNADVLNVDSSGNITTLSTGSFGDITVTGAGAQITFNGTAGGGGSGILYKDAGGGSRYGLRFTSDIVFLSNRASNGVVQIMANTASAGAGGEVLVVEFQDNLVDFQSTPITSSGNIDTTGNITATNFGAGGITSPSAPVHIKSDSGTPNTAMIIEENSGGEQWGIGVNSSGDLEFYDQGRATPGLVVKDSTFSRQHIFANGSYTQKITGSGGWEQSIRWEDDDNTVEVAIIVNSSDILTIGPTTSDRDRWTYKASTGEVIMYGTQPSIQQHAERTSGGVGVVAFSQYFKKTGETDTLVFDMTGVGTVSTPTSSILYMSFNTGDDGVVRFGADGRIALNQTGSRVAPVNLIEAHQVADDDGIKLYGFDDVSASTIETYIDSSGDAHIDTTGKMIINSETEVAGKMKLTAIGGYAILLTNKTGSNTVAGQLIKPDTATDDAFIIIAANDQEIIGIVLDTGIADGQEAWVVISGIADVLMDTGGSVRGDRIISSATAGSGDVWNVGGAVATHFQEIGHSIETRIGVGLARCVLHFN